MPASPQFIEQALKNNQEIPYDVGNNEEPQQPCELSLTKNKTFALVFLAALFYEVIENNPEAFDTVLVLTPGFLQFLLFFSAFVFWRKPVRENQDPARPVLFPINSHDKKLLDEEEWLNNDGEYDFEACFVKIKETLKRRYGDNANELITKLDNYFGDSGYKSDFSFELLSTPISIRSNHYNKKDILFMVKEKLPKNSSIFMGGFYTLQSPVGHRKETVQFRNLDIDIAFRNIIARDFHKIDDCLKQNEGKSLQDLYSELQILGKKFSAAPCEEKLSENRETPRLT